MSFDISPSGEEMAFGDVTGFVSQWSDRDDPKVNEFSLGDITPIDPYPTPPGIKMDQDSPLSMIVLDESLYNNQLLSFWNPFLSFPVPMAPKPMDTSLFPDYKQVDFVGYAKNPGIAYILSPNSLGILYISFLTL